MSTFCLFLITWIHISHILTARTFNSFLSLQGFLLYQKTTRNSYLESEDGPARPSSNMDRFERCFSIFKLSEEERRGAKQTDTENTPEDAFSPEALSQVKDDGPERTKPAGHKPWRAVRVDLVVSPISQFAFALLGWTGSKVTSHKWPEIRSATVSYTSTDSTLSAVVWEGAATLGGTREGHVSEQPRSVR